MIEPRGEVFDLGYQHYTGPRQGRMRARKAVWVNGVRTALGLGRGWTSKVPPVMLFIAVMFPAVVISIAASVVDLDDIGDVPRHAGYYQVISVILILFSGIIAPELLCPDRRDGVIYLYLVRPLTTTDYVVGRWLAFLSVSLTLVYAGQVVLLIGLTLAAAEPWHYLRDNWLDIPRFLAAGFVVAIFTTTIPLAVSAFTTRRAYAAAFVIGLFFISVPVSDMLAMATTCGDDRGSQHQRMVVIEGEHRIEVLEPEPCEPFMADAAKWFALINIGQVPMHVNDLIFAEKNDASSAKLVGELPDIVPIAWYLLLTAGPGYVLLWRYRRLRL